MGVKKGQELELEIAQVAFGGKGIARVDGMAVFVDQAVPGDRVLARIVRKKKSYAEARVLQLIAPSTERVEAPCPYSGICGGCKWQFLGYAHQLRYKQAQVRETLEHIGSIKEVAVHATVPSENIFGYRNKMEFSCATQRWLMPDELGREGVDTGMALGLHVPGTYFKVLDIQACLLQSAQGNDLLSDVRAFIRASGLPVYGLKTHQGFWRFLVLRHSVARDQWMVNIVTAGDNRSVVQELGDRLTRKYPNVVSVVNNITARKAAVAFGDYEIAVSGEPVIIDTIGSFEFEISANSFFQTNTRGAEHLYEAVKNYAALTGRETVVDLYCGAGTIGIYLSDRAKEVVGLELIESAMADANRNCRRNGIDNCRFIAGDIRQTLSRLDMRPDVMIIDPPRSGMHPDVVDRVLAIAPERIVYVSCNPATMARDLILMKECYQVAEVQPVDMFPHTFHIESVARLIRKQNG
jgi:23S rRNA (uracil1939-C5)-methyltransferase